MNYEDWEIENKVFEKPYEFGAIKYLIRILQIPEKMRSALARNQQATARGKQKVEGNFHN